MPSLLEQAVQVLGPRGLHDALTPEKRLALRFCWPARARPCEPREAPSWLRKKPRFGVWRGQMPPPGDWSLWLYMAGRASGKTLTGSNWCRSQAKEFPGSRGALLGATSADARRTMVKGKSGVLRISPPWDYPRWYHTDQTLTWREHRDSIATLYTADEPERLRGPEHDWAWVDELCTHKSTSAWDQLMMTMRGGRHPRVLITTTPKRIPAILKLLEEEHERLALTIGATSENTALPDVFLKDLLRNYQGTRLGRQELEGELISDVEGALWTLGIIDAARVREAPELQRVVIAVDPSGSSHKKSSLCGISVCGLDETGEHVFVLADLSMLGRPEAWANRVAWAYENFEADTVIGERNHGGEMVELTLRTGNPNLPVKLINASRGKFARAEPVSRLYEQGRVHHVAEQKHGPHPDENGHLAKLEDQMTSWTPAETYSPDRMDAMVYAVTELVLNASSFYIAGLKH